MIEKDIFFDRLNRIIAVWKSGESHANNLSKVQCLIFVVNNDIKTTNKTSSAVAMWLFGSEVHDTIVILNKQSMNIVTTSEYMSIFKPLEKNAKDTMLIDLHVINNDNDIKGKFENLIGSTDGYKKTVGIFGDTYCNAGFTEPLERFLDERYNKLDISNIINTLMAVKDSIEIEYMKDAGLILQSAMVHLNQSLIFLTCHKEEISHRHLADEVTETLIQHNPNNRDSRDYVDRRYFLRKLVERIDTIMQKEYCKVHSAYPIEMAYYPIISSNGIYSSEYDAGSDNNVIQKGVITLSLGIKLNGYCCNLTRTIMFNATKNIVANYKFLTKIQDLIMKKLKAGVVLNELHLIIMTFVTEKRPDLLKYLIKRFGTAIGIELKEKNISISLESTVKAQEGMTFNINVALVNLPNRETNSRYALWIADTVLVGKEESISLTEFNTHWKGMCFGYDANKTKRLTPAPFRTLENVSNINEQIV